MLSSMTNLAVDQWWLGGGGGSLEVNAWLLLGARMESSELVRPYTGAVGSGFLWVQGDTCLYLNSVCRKFLNYRQRCDWLSSSIPLPKFTWVPRGCYVSLHQTPRRTITNCMRVHRRPDPGLGEILLEYWLKVHNYSCPSLLGTFRTSKTICKYNILYLLTFSIIAGSQWMRWRINAAAHDIKTRIWMMPCLLPKIFEKFLSLCFRRFFYWYLVLCAYNSC